MRLRNINKKSRKIWKVDANVRKTQLFQKNFPNFVNRSVVAAPSMDDCPVLPAGSRGIRYASPYFLSVITFVRRAYRYAVPTSSRSVAAPSTDDCPVLPSGSRGIRYASPYFLSAIRSSTVKSPQSTAKPTSCNSNRVTFKEHDREEVGTSYCSYCRR